VQREFLTKILEFSGINLRSVGPIGQQVACWQNYSVSTPLFSGVFIMKTIRVPHSFGSFGAALVISGLPFLSALLPCASAQDQEAKKSKFFDWENLQSDVAGVADRTDSNLVNSWGLVVNSTGKVFWVSDNGSGVSTLYGADGTPVLLGNTQNFVTLPPTKVDTGSPPASAPTGIVLNSSPSAFLIPNTKSPAIFMWDGEDGGIWGWNPAVDLLNAVLIVQPASSDATVNNVFKGLAIADRKAGGPALFATNFRAGKVFVYDTNFHLVAQFTDPNPPLAVPPGTAGWAPFGIANIDGLLYVTFAAQNAAKHDDLAGTGRGFVDVFTPEGVLVKQLIVDGALNSPWGLAKVPEHERFGGFDDEVLLVGNFGDGHINAYDIQNQNSVKFLGSLQHRSGQPLEFNGLWTLFFLDDKLYFTAGIVDEAHGLFGFIHPQENENSDN
jgi:uncharacterized protein (TIGR03118 family)